MQLVVYRTEGLCIYGGVRHAFIV